MRYHKAKHKRTLDREFQRLRDRSLSADNRANKKKTKIAGVLCVVFWGISTFSLLILLTFAKNNLPLKLLIFVGAIILPTGFIIFMSSYIAKKYPYQNDYCIDPDSIKNITEKARKEYGIEDEYLVTKCLGCSNPIFMNRDVIIYKYNDSLRITNNLFFSPKDIGVYTFDFSEITIRYEYQDNVKAALLRCCDFEMAFPTIAKPYIEKLSKDAINRGAEG